LGWKQDDLAKASKIGIATIRRIEGQEGPVMGYVSTLMSIQSAFEKAGVRFLDNEPGGGIGVRLSEQKKS
jgi:transcriptional regulator with XRE-family HTH domain